MIAIQCESRGSFSSKQCFGDQRGIVVVDIFLINHISSQRANYGVSFVNIHEKIDRGVMAPHCIRC